MFDIARLHPISLRSARKKQQFPLFPCDIVASVWMNLKQIENLITSRVGFIPSHDSCLMPAAGKWVKPSQDIRWWAHIHNLPNLEAWKL